MSIRRPTHSAALPHADQECAALTEAIGQQYSTNKRGRKAVAGARLNLLNGIPYVEATIAFNFWVCACKLLFNERNLQRGRLKIAILTPKLFRGFFPPVIRFERLR